MRVSVDWRALQEPSCADSSKIRVFDVCKEGWIWGHIVRSRWWGASSITFIFFIATMNRRNLLRRGGGIYTIYYLIGSFFLTAWENQFLFIDRDRWSNEKRGNMSRESIVESTICQGYLYIITDFLEMEIIMEVFDIFVIRDISADCGVSWLADVFWRCMILFFVSSTVYGLFDNFPSEIMIRNLALNERSRSGECWHYRCPWQEHVIKVACMVNILRLVCDL